MFATNAVLSSFTLELFLGDIRLNPFLGIFRVVVLLNQFEKRLFLAATISLYLVSFDFIN